MRPWTVLGALLAACSLVSLGCGGSPKKAKTPDSAEAEPAPESTPDEPPAEEPEESEGPEPDPKQEFSEVLGRMSDKAAVLAARPFKKWSNGVDSLLSYRRELKRLSTKQPKERKRIERLLRNLERLEAEVSNNRKKQAQKALKAVRADLP